MDVPRITILAPLLGRSTWTAMHTHGENCIFRGHGMYSLQSASVLERLTVMAISLKGSAEIRILMVLSSDPIQGLTAEFTFKSLVPGAEHL